MISAIHNDERILMHVNVRNNGTISELPAMIVPLKQHQSLPRVVLSH
ncbi:hypothetical protein L0B53_01375 [Vibrio sp. SS-MA-C1-2]|nr:hypothetical protein L0B53_01375 [Vibrio sp. SS-MA-C1-2]